MGDWGFARRLLSGWLGFVLVASGSAPLFSNSALASCPSWVLHGDSQGFEIPAEWRRNPDLNEELTLSRLTPEQVQNIQTHSAGVLSIQEFMARETEIHPRYRLGLDFYHLAWSAISRVTDIFKDAYSVLYVPRIPRSPQTDTLLTRMTIDAENGKPIVFLVPREVLTHPARFATADEMEWLLNHPDKMKRVSFVFGAYNILTDEGYQALSQQLHDGELEAQALAQVYEGMKR